MREVLPDVLASGLAVVFCGTAASAVSAEVGAYYANPGNAFWRSLFAIGMTPRLFAPSDFRKLLDLKIGLTDLAKFAVGNDSDLASGDFDRAGLDEKIEIHQPQILALTSKRAWRVWKNLPSSRPVSYGWQAETIYSTRVYVLPSPSGAARGYWQISPWQALGEVYQARMLLDDACDSGSD